jgi:putative AlgH/UPF0301 family transcriptional regulator
MLVLLVASAAVHSWVITSKLREIVDSMHLHTYKPSLIAVRPTQTDDGLKLGITRIGWPAKELKPGLLISAASKVPGSIFNDSVVLIVQYSIEHGAVGFIINRPAHGGLTYIGVTHSQGPMGRSDPYYLSEKTSAACYEIIPGLCFVQDDDNLDPSTSYLKFYGYAGWSSLQLDGEFRAGEWTIVSPADAHSVLEIAGKPRVKS